MALISTNDLLEGDLFELLGIANAPEERKTKIIQTMMSTIDARVVNRVSDQLSEEDAVQFQKISENGDKEAIVQFLVDKEIDLPEIVSQEATRHRVEIIELANLVQEK